MAGEVGETEMGRVSSMDKPELKKPRVRVRLTGYCIEIRMSSKSIGPMRSGHVSVSSSYR